MADKKINIGLGFNVDKTNLNTLKTELQSLLNMSTDDLIKIGSENAVADLKEIQTAASAVQSALEKSFNPKLNTQDLTKFQQELKMSGQSIGSIKAGLDKAGASGQNAFRNITAELLTTNRQLKQSSQWLDKMAETMANTVRWTVASSALNAVTGSIQKAYSFTKQLDTSLNDIRIVTGKSADEMARFAKEATTAAKNLGSTTTAYTKAALIYEQQGLGEADVAARTDVTTKVSNVTGQGAADVSEQLTAIWNGYKVSAAEAELYIDKVSAVAATTAADLEELSEGMGKVASAANSMGVDIDQLNASLATIISVTRQDASAVGTSLKTIYARMGDLAVDGEDEFGVKLGDVSGKLKTMGIDILDAQGQMREMGEVIEEVAEKWDTWTNAQQQAAAVALAGKRQYNNLIALFENWDMYEEAKSTSQGGAGELQKQQDIYMESMEAHLNQLQAEAEELYQTLLDPEGLNPLIDALTSIVGLAENLIESLGGGAGLLRTVGAIGFNVFGKQITKGVTGAINNITGFRENLKQAAAEASIVQELELTNPENEETRQIIALAKERLKIAKSMTAEEYEITNQVMKQANAAFDQKQKLEQQRDELADIIKAHTGIEIKINNVTGEIEEAEQALKDLKTSTEEGLNRDIDTGGQALKEVEELYTFQSQVDAKQRSKNTYEGWITRRDNDLTNATEAVNMHYMGGRDQDTEDDFWEGVATQAQYEEKIAEAKRKIAQATDELANAQNILNEKNNESHEYLVALIQDLQDQNKQTSFTISEQEELKQITKDITKVFNEQGKIIEGTTAGAMKKAIDGIKRYNQILGKQKTAVNEAIKNGKKFNDNLRAATKAADEAKNKLEQLKKSFDLTKTVENITKLTGGFTNLAAGIETIKGLGDIWTDDNLTGGEKFLQTVTAIGFGLPQIVSGISGMFQGIKGLTEAYQNFNTAKTAAIALNKAMQAEEITEATLTSALALAKSKLTEEEYEKLTAQLAGTEVQKKAAKETLKSIVSDNAKSFSLMGLAGAAKTAGAAIKTATTAFLTSPIGWIVLAVTAAIAATAALIHLIKAYNTTDEEAFNNAKQRQNELSQALQETKQKYDDLKNSIEDYKNARNSLDELTAGTTAWKEALADANSQALALLQTYPELAKYVHKDENGLITIAEEGLNALADKQLNDIYKAQTASLIGGAIARDAKNELDTSNKSKDFGVNEKTLDAILKLESDTILNPDEFANSLKSESIGIKDEALINSLNENREEIFALKQTVDTTNHLLAVESGEIIGNILKRYGYDLDAGALGGIITSNMLAEGDQQEAIDELKESISIFSGSFDAWAHAMGIEADAGSFKNDTWNAQIKYTVGGEEKTISYDQFKKELATYKYYYENTQEYLDDAIQLLENIGKTTTTETNNIVRSIFASNTAVTKEQIKDFNKEILDELQKVLDNEAQVLTEGQKKILNETKSNLQYSLDYMGKERGWFDLNLKDNVNPIENALVTLFDSESWTDLINSGIDYSALSGIGDVLSNIRLMEGEDGLSNILTFLNRFEDPAASLEGIDWNSETLGADIVNKMYDFGMEVDFTDEVISTAILHFTQLTDALESTAERAANTKKIIDNLNYGDIISKEDFEYLQINYGSLLNSYFTQMEDGTAVLTASAWEFYEVYHKLDVEKRKQRAEELKGDYNDFKSGQSDQLTWLDDQAGSKVIVDRAAERAQYIQDNFNVEETFTSDGITFWTTPDGTGQYARTEATSEHGISVTDKELTPVIKRWLNSGSKNATEYKESIETSFGKKIEELTADEWEDILQDRGFFKGGMSDGDTVLGGLETSFTLDLDKTLGTGGVKVTLQEIRDDIVRAQLTAEANEKYANTYYYQWDQAKIEEFVKNAKTAGYISEDAYNEYLAGEIEKPENYKTDNESDKAPIIDLVNKAIEETQGGTEALQTELLGLLQTATDQSEFDEFKTYIRDTYSGILSDTTINDIIEQGLPRAQINFEQTAIKKHETSISNINEAYQDISEIIESLNKQLDNLYGTKRAQSINYINALIDRQNTLLSYQSQKAQNEITRQITEDTEVKKAFNKIGRFSTMLEDGILTVDEYNQMVNSLLDSKNEEFTEPLNTIITSLGPLFDTITNSSNSILDNNLQKIENALDAFDIKFREAHERNEIAKSYNDFMKEFTAEDDDYFNQLKYDIDSYKVAFDDADQSMTKIKELAAATVNETGEGYIIEGEILTLEQLRTQVLEEGANLQEYALTLKESLTNLQELEMSQLEEVAEQYDNIVGYAESWNELLEHQLTLSQLINGENYEANKNIYSAQEASLKEQLRLRKEEYETYRSIVDKGPGADEAGYKEAQQKMLEAGQDVAAITTELAQFLVDDFARKIKGNFDSLYEGIESAQKQYEWISERSEKIFDQITGALESQKAVNEWTKVMNDTQDTRAQKQMKDFISAKENELKLRREASKLSQHDLDIAQAEFDLLQAKIALEDARNNKTQMRLTRGADGSYSYQYVANTAAIVEAEQAVADASQNVMEKSKNAVKEAIESVTDGLVELKDYYIEAFSDNKLDDIEKNTLTKMWDAIVKDEELLQERVGESIIAMRKAAAAAGISVTELNDEQMKQFFPELDSSLYDWIKTVFGENGSLADFNFIEMLESDAKAAEELLKTLGGYNKYITTTTGDDKKSLVEEIKELLTSLGKDEKLALTASIIIQLDEISKATDSARESFDKFATSITTVVGSLKELGTTTTSEEWLKILNGDEEKGIVGLKNLSVEGVNKDGNIGKTTFIDEWNDIKTNISNSISNLVTETTNTLKNFGSLIKDKIMNTEIASTVKTEIGNISISFPDAINREEITGALEDFFNNTEQFVAGGGASHGDIGVPITPPIVHSGVSVPRIPSTVRPEIK